jgi:hypothetical protein
MASQYDLVVIGGEKPPGSVSAAGTASLGAKVASPAWHNSSRERLVKAGVSGEHDKAAEKESSG